MSGPEWKIFNDAGEALVAGDKVIDGRGGVWTFDSIYQPPSPGRSGKVVVSRGEEVRTFYPGVFALEFRDIAKARGES